jgi:dUTP pyrophosphatase
LHAVDAVARYSKNLYKISCKGKSATLQGCLYTQKEVQLPASLSSDEEEEAEEASETLSNSMDEEDDGMIKAYMTSAINLEQFAMRPIMSEPMMVQRLSPEAEIPKRMSEESVGYDLYASACVVVPPWNQALVPTDIAIDIPSSHFGLIKPRSGLALKEKITIDAGVIDCDYKGNMQILLVNCDNKHFVVEKGDHIAQLILVKNITPEIKEVTTLPMTKKAKDRF